MKKQTKIIERVTKQFINQIVEQEVLGWPPQCGALYFQPVRPKKEEVVQPSCEQYTEKL